MPSFAEWFGLKKKKPAVAEARRLAVKDYEKIGQQVASLYDAINPDRKGLYRTAFLKGIFTGVGGVIGATLVVAIVLWILASLGHVPFVGPVFQNVENTIQDTRK